MDVSERLKLVQSMKSAMESDLGKAYLKQSSKLEILLPPNLSLQEIAKKLTTNKYKSKKEWVDQLTLYFTKMAQITGRDCDIYFVAMTLFDQIMGVGFAGPQITCDNRDELLLMLKDVIHKIPQSKEEVIHLKDVPTGPALQRPNPISTAPHVTRDDVIEVGHHLTQLKNDQELEDVLRIVKIFDQNLVSNGRASFSSNQLSPLTIALLKKHFAELNEEEEKDKTNAQEQ